MLKLDGKTLVYDRAFTLSDGRQFPANWLRKSTLSEKNSIGITEVADVVTSSYNQKFYWGVNNPKDIDQLKVQWIATQKREAASHLAPTDWLVTRYAEAATVIPVKTKDYRAAVRTVCGEREAQITACADTDELCALITGTLPSYVNGDEKKDEDDKSFDPKQFEQVANPALLKDWPTE